MNRRGPVMGKTIAQKIFDTHLRDKPFGDEIFVLNLDAVF